MVAPRMIDGLPSSFLGACKVSSSSTKLNGVVAFSKTASVTSTCFWTSFKTLQKGLKFQRALLLS